MVRAILKPKGRELGQIFCSLLSKVTWTLQEQSWTHWTKTHFPCCIHGKDSWLAGLSLAAEIHDWLDCGLLQKAQILHSLLDVQLSKTSAERSCFFCKHLRNNAESRGVGCVTRAEGVTTDHQGESSEVFVGRTFWKRSSRKNKYLLCCSSGIDVIEVMNGTRSSCKKVVSQMHALPSLCLRLVQTRPLVLWCTTAAETANLAQSVILYFLAFWCASSTKPGAIR